jgi:hypothetical protein
VARQSPCHAAALVTPHSPVLPLLGRSTL